MMSGRMFRAALAGLVGVAGAGMASAQEKYVGEVFSTAGTYCPTGTLEANGATLPLMDYQVLYAVIGTTYGGDARTAFNVPDLRGRTMVGIGSGPGLAGVSLGTKRGAETVMLTIEVAWFV